MPPEWAGKSLVELNLRNEHGFNVVGMKRGDEMIMQIDPRAALQKDTLLYVIGKNEDLEKFQN